MLFVIKINVARGLMRCAYVLPNKRMYIQINFNNFPSFFILI